MGKGISGLYFITDSRLSKQGILADARQAIEAGCRMLQYREKCKTRKEMLEEARQLAAMCKEKGVLFIVNDCLDIALAVGADGVHLGQHDLPVAEARRLLGPGKVIGTSNHSLEQAKQSIAQNVDYLSVGPIFPTTTKKDVGPAVGIALLRQVRALTRKPVVAIGGINEENLGEVLEARPDCVAMISAIVCSESPERTARRVVERMGKTV